MKRITSHLTKPISMAPLASFRVLFGLMMLVSIVRFALKGWIQELYLMPAYHFPYWGFEWVQPLGSVGMPLLFAVMALAAIAIMVGWQYRAATVLFFLAFTYVELIDKTNYLNHYYFVSIVSFLLILVPADRQFSLRVWRKPAERIDEVPAWMVNIFKLQLGIVYVYAGLAKLHPDWLLEAMPLKLWLPAFSHLPIVGGLLAAPATAFAFSWFGAAYDLFVVFFLLMPRTRIWAYGAVLAFHLMTAFLFQIGMFPYIMILSTLIFFSAEWHLKVQRWVAKWILRARNGFTRPSDAPVVFTHGQMASRLLAGLVIAHFAVQLLLPFRFALYPGSLFWTEQGYRFSWRVMLMEKAGYAAFKVHDPDTGRHWEVANYDFLTPVQEKMMATQPDMILQFAHFLEAHYQEAGWGDVEITADAFVTLNGRRSQRFVDPNVDLTRQTQGLHHKSWILPLEQR